MFYKKDETKAKEYVEKGRSFGFPKDPYDLIALGNALGCLSNDKEALEIF